LQGNGNYFDVVNEEKLDSRPAEECAGVALAGKECAQGKFERVRLRSLVWSNANVQVIPSKERNQKNSNEFKLYATCKDVYG
jgi:hypothetical protein